MVGPAGRRAKGTASRTIGTLFLPSIDPPADGIDSPSSNSSWRTINSIVKLDVKKGERERERRRTSWSRIRHKDSQILKEKKKEKKTSRQLSHGRRWTRKGSLWLRPVTSSRLQRGRIDRTRAAIQFRLDSTATIGEEKVTEAKRTHNRKLIVTEARRSCGRWVAPLVGPALARSAQSRGPLRASSLDSDAQ